MRSQLAKSLLVASLFLAAGAARAGTFPSPFSASGANCGDSDYAAAMLDPSVLATGEKCESLCAKAVSGCRAFVRRIVGCYVAYYTTTSAFIRKSCLELATPELVAECKADIDADLHDIKESLSLERATELVACQSWGLDCQLACP